MPWGCKRRAERRQVTETESRLERERSELCGALANRTVQWGAATLLWPAVAMDKCKSGSQTA